MSAEIKLYEITSLYDDAPYFSFLSYDEDDVDRIRDKAIHVDLVFTERRLSRVDVVERWLDDLIEAS